VKLPVRTGRAVAALRVAGPKVPTATNLGIGARPAASSPPEPIATLPVEAPSPGKRLGNYLLEELVGRGGMGQVFRARDEILHRTVAVKVVALELSSDPRFNERFMREARALASLNTPYITQIYSVSQNEVPAYFAMEFVEGRTLRQYLEEKRTLSVDDALDVFHQIVLGLSAAAQKGVIHRDVKPENVMLTHKGDVKLTDFGLVKSAEVDARTTTVGMIFGTPYYMSPEQARGEEIDFRADMYSAGALLFEVLTGEPPFHGPTALNILYRHQEDPLPTLQQIGHTFPTRVYSIIERLMAKKREDRYGNYDELVRAIEEAQRLAASGVVSRVGASLATGSSEG
jgi:serine/threonine-protein kinase